MVKILVPSHCSHCMHTSLWFFASRFWVSGQVFVCHKLIIKNGMKKYIYGPCHRKSDSINWIKWYQQITPLIWSQPSSLTHTMLQNVPLFSVYSGADILFMPVWVCVCMEKRNGSSSVGWTKMSVLAKDYWRVGISSKTWSRDKNRLGWGK